MQVLRNRPNKNQTSNVLRDELPLPPTPTSLSHDDETLPVWFRTRLPIEELEAELALANQLTALGKRKLARYLFDMHERGVHMETEHSTAAHYEASRLGLKETEANRYLLDGRRPPEPHVERGRCSAAGWEGLSWLGDCSTMGAMEPEPDPEEIKDSVQVAARALRSRRHAEMLFAAVAGQLGDAAWEETRNGGAFRQLFRRDRTEPDWLVPWPVLELSVGTRIGVVTDWIQVGDAPIDPSEPKRPIPPKLRGLGPGEIRILDGAEHIDIVYNEDGAQFETCRSAQLNALAGLAAALAGAAANPIELLARFIADLDPARHGPARVHLPVRMPHGAGGVWRCGLQALRRGLFEDRVPSDARWAAADGLTGSAFGFGATREAALAGWRVAVAAKLPWPEPRPAQEPPPEPVPGDGTMLIRAPEPDVPLPDPKPGNVPVVLVPIGPRPSARPSFGSWQATLGGWGATRFVARKRKRRGFTLIGEDVLRSVDLARLDEEFRLAEQLQEERFAEVIEKTPGVTRRPCRTAEYRVDPAGRLRPDRSSEGPDWNAGSLDGDVVAARVVRQRWVDVS